MAKISLPADQTLTSDAAYGFGQVDEPTLVHCVEQYPRKYGPKDEQKSFVMLVFNKDGQKHNVSIFELFGATAKTGKGEEVKLGEYNRSVLGLDKKPGAVVVIPDTFKVTSKQRFDEDGNAVKRKEKYDIFDITIHEISAEEFSQVAS